MNTTAKPAIPTPDEEWEELEKKREQLKGARFEKHVDEQIELREKMVAVDKKIETLYGDVEIANQQVVLSLARRSGDKGVPLADLRRLIPDPNHLNKAREELAKTEDENKNKVEPKTREVRGDSNELRILLVTKEES